MSNYKRAHSGANSSVGQSKHQYAELDQYWSSNQLLPNVLRDFLVQNSINLKNFSSASVDNLLLVILFTDAQADEKDVSTAGSKK